MTLKYVLAAALSIAGIAGVLYLTLGGERLVPLSDLADTPRPPVTANKQTTAQLLSGLHDPFPPTGKDDLVNAKRRARNALAESVARSGSLTNTSSAAPGSEHGGPPAATSAREASA